MWNQFLLENAHFAVNLLAALVTFAVFWLYFDAWTAQKSKKEILKIAGFLLLSLSFLLHATNLEFVVISSSGFLGLSNEVITIATAVGRNLGYALVLLGLALEPIQPRPKISSAAALIVLPPLLALQPILASLVAWMYLRRATLGYEAYLRKAVAAFFLLSTSELLSLAALFQNTTNVTLYQLVSPFGTLWIVEHLLLLAASLVLGIWAFGHLLKRIQTQLFIIFTTAILAVFLVTAVAFTTLLIGDLRNEALRHLETDVKTLSLALQSKQGETLSDAQVLAQDQEIQSALQARNTAALNSLAEGFLLNKKESTLVITNESGQVLARAEESEQIGGSLSEDSLVKRALLGEGNSSISIKSGTLAPQVYVRSAVPIQRSGAILGTVTAGTLIDNAFLDNIKRITGLEASLYGGDTLSATTLTNFSGGVRPLGIKETNPDVAAAVLGAGEPFSGAISLLNTPYLAAYLPLKDIDNEPVGMLFAGRPELTVLQTAGRSIQVTFLVTVALLMLAVVPAYFTSRYITSQIR